MSLEREYGFPAQVVESADGQGHEALLSHITEEIEDILEPWRRANCCELLPNISLKELSRRVGESPRHLIEAIKSHMPKFYINERGFDVNLEGPTKPYFGAKIRRRWQRRIKREDWNSYNTKIGFES